MRALNIAATGMAAQNMRVEVISHNLANMNTTAYNARRAEFSDLHYQQIAAAGHDQLGRRHGAAGRRAARSRRAGGGGVDADRAGHGGRDRRRARPRDRGPGLSRDHAAERRPGLHPRRRAEAQRRRAGRHLGRLFGGARHHRPRGRPADHHQRLRRGLRLLRRRDRGAAARPVRPRHLHQREGPRGGRLATSTSRPRPRARRTSATPARTGAAPSARATSRTRASTRCARSPG